MDDLDARTGQFAAMIAAAWDALDSAPEDPLSRCPGFGAGSRPFAAVSANLPLDELRAGGPVARAVCELAFTQLAYEHSQRALQLAGSEAAAGWARRAANLLDLALCLARNGLCDPAFDWTALGHAMRTVPLRVAECLFGYLETRAAALSAEISPRVFRGQLMLRLLNDLLGRLSKTQYPAFRARIHAFVDNCTVLSERSGVNVGGHISTKNPAEYDRDAKRVEESLREGGESPDAGEQAELYECFWSLQDYYSAPSRIFDGDDSFAKFEEQMRTVLRELSRRGGEREAGSGRPWVADRRARAFGQYLTSPRLLKYQLRDARFRFQFLAQSLIVCGYLLGATRDKREALLSTAGANRSMVPRFELSPSQAQSIQGIREQIAKQLRASGAFGHPALLVSQHEKHWVEWKQRGCPANELEPIPAVDDEVRSATAWFNTPQDLPGATVIPMGSGSFAELWGLDLGDAKALQGRRAELPPVDECLRRASEIEGQPVPATRLPEAREVERWKLRRAVMAQDPTCLLKRR